MMCSTSLTKSSLTVLCSRLGRPGGYPESSAVLGTGRRPVVVTCRGLSFVIGAPPAPPRRDLRQVDLDVSRAPIYAVEATAHHPVDVVDGPFVPDDGVAALEVDDPVLRDRELILIGELDR